MGKYRTMSVCLSDIPKERFYKHENGKIYLQLSTYDKDETDQYGNDFSVSLPRTKEENERIGNGEKLDRIFCGNGKIWEDKKPVMQPVEDVDDLPF